MADKPRKALGRILNPPKPIDMESLPAMLRIPKTKPEAAGE